MKVGQVLARIKAGEAPAKTEGQGTKQEDAGAGAGATPAESTALDTEAQGDSGTNKHAPLPVTHGVAS